MPFETFNRQRARSGREPSLTIQKKGVLSLNRAAYEELGNPESVELLYDSQERLMALRKAEPSLPHSYKVRGMGQSRGTWLVSGTAFTNFYDIDTSVPTRRTGRIEEDMLIIDLNDPGTEVLPGRGTESDDESHTLEANDFQQHD